MGRDAPSYVERQADRDLLQGLLDGEFCYVLTSRQMGKSSLMVRTADKLRREGVNALVLDLSAIGQNLTPEQWYDGFMVRMGRQSSLEDELDDFWSAHQQLSPVQRCFTAIRDLVLPKQPGRLVIFVDEIDVVRSLPFSMDEFFAAIRECYNRRTEDPELERLNFCLLGVATPSDLIRDTRITPFNIGRRIELHDFTEQEARPLATGLHLRAGASQAMAEKLLDRVLLWTNGHPYLTQRLCRELAHDETDIRNGRHSAEQLIDRLCHDLFFSSRASERDDNLVFVRERLLRSEVNRASLLNLYERIARHKDVADDETNPLVSVLRLSGVVRAVSGRLVTRNRIYEHVFNRSWIRANLPQADLLRQREAFRRGVLRTTAIAAVILTAMAIMVFIALSLATKARRALAQSWFSEARTMRLSGVSGGRKQSLDTLQKAHPFFSDKAALRDETVAALALSDLEEQNDTPGVPHDTNAFALNLEHGISAAADSDGGITFRWLKDRTVIENHPGFGSPIKQLRFSRRQPYLVIELAPAASSGGTPVVRDSTAELGNSIEPVSNQSNLQNSKSKTGPVIVWNWKEHHKLFQLDHGIYARAIDISAKETVLAIADKDAWVRCYALPSGQKLSEFRPLLSSQRPRRAASIRLNPAADVIAISSAEDQFVELWDLKSNKRIERGLHHPNLVHDLSWHVQGHLLATACSDGAIYLWNLDRLMRNRNDLSSLQAAGVSKTEPERKFIGHENQVTRIAFTHSGNFLASVGTDATLRLWTFSGDIRVLRQLQSADFSELQFDSDDRRLLATGKIQNNCRLWNILGGEYSVLYQRANPFQDFASIDFSPDGRLLATATTDTIAIWDTEYGRQLNNLSFTNISSARFCADGIGLFVSTDDGLRYCHLQRQGTGRDLSLTIGSISRLNSVSNELGYLSLTPNRKRAALVRQTKILLLDLERDVAPMTSRISIGERLTKMAIHPDGTWLAGVPIRENLIHIFNPEGRSIFYFPVCVGRGEHFGFSPNGEWFAVCASNRFELYRTNDWKKCQFAVPRSSGGDQAGPLAFTYDSKILAVADSRYRIRLYSLPQPRSGGRVIAPPMTAGAPATLPLLATLEGPDPKPLIALAFSADGRRLAAAARDQTIQLWNLGLILERLADLNLQGNWPGYTAARNNPPPP